MNSIAQGYAHLYHTVPEQLGPKITRAAVVASLVTVVALAVLYPFGTSLVVGTFLAGGVASYCWAYSHIEMHDNTPFSLAKISLAFQVALFTDEERRFIPFFLNFTARETAPEDKAAILGFIKDKVPPDKRYTLYLQLGKLGTKRDYMCGELRDILITIFKTAYSEEFVGQSASFIEAFNLVYGEVIAAAMDILFKQEDRELFIEQILELRRFIGSNPTYTKAENEEDITELMDGLAALDQQQRAVFIGQSKELLQNFKNIYAVEVIQALMNVPADEREGFLDAFNRWFRLENQPPIDDFLSDLINAEDRFKYVHQLEINAIMTEAHGRVLSER